MRKLSALVAWLITEFNVVAAEKIESFNDIDEYVLSGDAVDNGNMTGICLYDQVYSALIRIEDLNAKSHPVSVVLGKLACWIMTNDPLIYRKKIEPGENGERINLALIDINSTLESDESVSLEFIVPFREPVFGIEDSAGIFALNGKLYRLADESNPDEQFEINYILNIS